MARQTKAAVETREAAAALKAKLEEHCKNPLYKRAALSLIDDAMQMFEDSSGFGVKDPSLPLV